MNAGTEKQLSCRASGAKPQAKIVWYHGHNKILDQGTLSSLLIHAVFLSFETFKSLEVLIQSVCLHNCFSHSKI